ncbi:hypothetical protein HNP86_001840 [Methanococcus maripaludis]|uniref:Uncharacterized protein n=1 Tax=Methanococcus maripaludis TaxID=39152 RepID=A0A7J9NWI7_METMI|nr:hypothetical protein [Methanococcus maripaludis]MBA2851681.1 hypothetical protein [Methanococcus maripaludis]
MINGIDYENLIFTDDGDVVIIDDDLEGIYVSMRDIVADVFDVRSGSVTHVHTSEYYDILYWYNDKFSYKIIVYDRRDLAGFTPINIESDKRAALVDALKVYMDEVSRKSYNGLCDKLTPNANTKAKAKVSSVIDMLIGRVYGSVMSLAC